MYIYIYMYMYRCIFTYLSVFSWHARLGCFRKLRF